MILSTAWTTLAVIAMEKTETRRDWSPKQIALARKQMESRKRVDLWDKSPRFKGKPYGSCLIVSLIEQEDASTIPDEAWSKEGFHLLSAIGASFMKGLEAPDVWRNWRHSEPGTNLQTVVGIGSVDLNSYADRLWSEAVEKYGDKLLSNVTLAEVRRSTAHLPEWSKA